MKSLLRPGNTYYKALPTAVDFKVCRTISEIVSKYGLTSVLVRLWRVLDHEEES